MATSKTLTPTNVTIQIPEFTDQPDQRVNSNCIDKEADAINALNTHLTSISDKIASCLAIEWKSIETLTIPANTTADAQIPVTKSGYTFIGILGWIINSGGNACTTHARYYDANTAVVRVFNPTSSPISTGSVQVRCLYVKNGSGLIAYL